MYYRELRMENFADERNSTTTTTTSVPDLPTLKKRTATITPASGAVTVSPTSVPSYATYCSSASACKFEKDYPRVSPISSLPHPTPPATILSRKSLTLPSRLQRMLLCGRHRYTTTAPTPTYTSTVTATITCAAERKIKRGIAYVGNFMNYGRM